MMKQGVPDSAKQIRQIESEIDLILYDFMNLSKNESILIEDVLTYGLDFFQHQVKNGVNGGSGMGPVLPTELYVTCNMELK